MRDAQNFKFGSCRVFVKRESLILEDQPRNQRKVIDGVFGHLSDESPWSAFYHDLLQAVNGILNMEF